MTERVYVLMYDMDTGSSESFNLNYMPAPEVYSSEEALNERMAFLDGAIDEDGFPCKYEYYIWSQDVLDKPLTTHHYGGSLENPESHPRNITLTAIADVV